MSVLGEVFGSVQNMGFVQLLLAFVACFGYALAQGGLLSGKGRRMAWTIAFIGAAGFAVVSPDWPNAVMLIALAVVAVGSLAALAWVVSRVVGVDRRTAMSTGTTMDTTVDTSFAPSAPAPLAEPGPLPAVATSLKDRREAPDGSAVSA